MSSMFFLYITKGFLHWINLIYTLSFVALEIVQNPSDLYLPTLMFLQWEIKKLGR